MRAAAALLALLAACGGGGAPETTEPAAEEKLPPAEEEPAAPEHDVGLPEDPPLDADGLPPKTVPLAELEANRLSGHLEGVTATFVAKLCVDAKGAPSAVKLLKSSGDHATDRSVLLRLVEWRFKPFLVETVPVAACTIVGSR